MLPALPLLLAALALLTLASPAGASDFELERWLDEPDTTGEFVPHKPARPEKSMLTAYAEYHAAHPTAHAGPLVA